MLVDARDGDVASQRATHEVAAAIDGPLRRAGWGLQLPAWFTLKDGSLRCEPRQFLETAPFYARYVGALQENGKPLATGMGEYLDLDRFSGRGIQFLLRFKTRKVS